MMPWLAHRYGGPAISVPEAAVALSRRGHEVEIVTTNADGPGRLNVPTGHVLDWAGSRVTFHPLSAPSSYLTSWPLLADLRRRVRTFDIVHIHCLYRFHGLAAAAVARLDGVPYVIQAHGSLDRWHRNRKRHAKDVYHAVVEDPIIRGASAIQCTSTREEGHIHDLGYSVPMWVIPIGIDASALREPGDPGFLETAGIAADRRVVTFLGRLSAKKGVPLLVESFRRTAASQPLAHLVIAGPDESDIVRNLAPMIAGWGLAERISFIGPVSGSEKRALLQRSEVFVLPSADESFGVAVAEAIAVGCPVVLSPEVATQDVVRARRAGLVAERSADAMAEAVGMILSDPVRARAMGDAGRDAVDELFEWAGVAEQTESMYEAVLHARRGRPRPAKMDISTVTTPDDFALHCPRCHGSLHASDRESRCASCGWTSSTGAGVAILLPDATAADHDELDHRHGSEHKAAQALHFDRADDERFETERPHGSPRLYRFLLGEKFRRSVAPVRPHLVRASALTVCGGSGMDAEYLSRAGATVVNSDLSLGAAIRAKARSERYGLGIQSIVADVEHLPFVDQSVDLVSVHDGLHHLSDPYAGLSEMARVARRWVVVTEPAQASATRVAILFGLARDREAAGNRVARLEPSEVAGYLEGRGFTVLQASRYAMYYPHRPGAVFGLLSRPAIYPIVRLAWRLANALLGRFGNKMVVVAQRAPR